MADAFSAYPDLNSSPGRRLRTVAASDSSDLADLPKALLISGTGTVSVIAADDADNGVVGVPVSGVLLLPVRVRRVMSTGTTPGVTIIAIL